MVVSFGVVSDQRMVSGVRRRRNEVRVSGALMKRSPLQSDVRVRLAAARRAAAALPQAAAHVGGARLPRAAVPAEDARFGRLLYRRLAVSGEAVDLERESLNMTCVFHDFS